MEPAGSSHSPALYHGHHPGGDQDERSTANQPHHHPHYEGAEDSQRYFNFS